jgi:hypothetical protein
LCAHLSNIQLPVCMLVHLLIFLSVLHADMAISAYIYLCIYS